MDWARLEGGTVDPDMTEGIASPIADPLWLLARQWQVGEFKGEDAASPVMLDAVVVGGPVTEFWVDGDNGRWTVERSDAQWPLETHVEHEPVAAGPSATRHRLESGAALVRDLGRAGVPEAQLADLRNAFALEVEDADGELGWDLDPVGAAQLAFLARRVPDGSRVADAIAAAGGDPTLVAELAALPGPAVVAAANWYGHLDDRFCDVASGAPSAWDPTRLEYRFGLAARIGDARLELDAPEYPGGMLDWFHFDVAAPADAASGDEPGRFRKRLTSLPNPVRFAGMPASRWWEFEDRDVDFGDMAGGPEDLARSVLAAFAMVAGDDWYSVPCELPVGSISRVEQLRVLDDFGNTTPVRAVAAADAADAGQRVWKFFELRDDPGPSHGEAPMLFLPPIVAASEASGPIEQVDFRRDEMANLSWAVEHRVESPAGRPVDRHARRPQTSSTGPVESSADPDAWRFRLSTDVPDEWVPLVPVRIDGDRPQIALRRGRLAVDGDEQRARGRILEPERAFVMHEEEIRSGGLRVERRWQLARGADGAVRLWVGRRKSPGGGPMRRTPLRFDHLTGFRERPTS